MNKTLLSFSLLTIILLNVCLYQWTIKEPYMGDSLMHIADDTQIHSIQDVVKTFFMNKNPKYNEQFRIQSMHRPIFNELIITAEKKIIGIKNLRYISLIIQIINSILIYYLIYLLTKSDIRSLIGSIFYVTNPVFFYGLYEFGLSFSGWLSLFVISTFIFTYKYLKEFKKVDFILANMFLFFSLFTKESSITLPFAICIFTVMITHSINNRINLFNIFTVLFKNKRILLFHLTQFMILIIYLITRYIKLGSIFEVHAGIGGAISVKEIIYKITGYFLLTFNIATPIIPGYMAIDIIKYNPVVILLILLNFIVVFGLILRNLIFRNVKVFCGLIMFILLLAPVFKVTRNAPYYIDIPIISVILTIVFIEVNIERVNFKRLVSISYKVYLIGLVLINVSFQYITTKNTTIWLTTGEENTKKIISSIKAIPNDDIRNTRNISMLSSFFNDGEKWVYNHGRIGSSLYANLGIDFDKINTNYHSTEDLKDSLILDMYYEENNNNIVSNKSNATLQYTSGVNEIKLIQSYKNTFQFNSNGNELLEIKGKIKTEDINNLPSLSMTFHNNINSGIVKKMYSSLGSMLPNANGKEFTIFSLTPAETSTITINKEISDFVEYFEIKRYSLIKRSQEDALKNTRQLIKNNSFEDELNGWIQTNKVSLVNDSHTGKNGIKVGPGISNNIFQIIDNISKNSNALLSLWAKTDAGTNQKGRLQINWIDSKGGLVSSSIEVIDIESNFREYSLTTKVPTGATRAIIYITPHDEKSVVIYDDINMFID